jgi:hypothetical protein
MIKKVEVIGLPGQGKSTLIGNYLNNSKKEKDSFLFSGFFYLPFYIIFWTRVLFFGKSKNIPHEKYFKIILKRGFDSFVSYKKLVDEGSLQNFLSFFEEFDSIEKIKKYFKYTPLPRTVIVVEIKDKEKSLYMSGLRLEKRRGLTKERSQEVSIKMKKVLDELVAVLNLSGVRVIFIDSFDSNSSEMFNQYLHEKNT